MGKDPLNFFFYALDRVAEITGVKGVLPAHGHPFQDLPGRAEAIKRHHRERLARGERQSALQCVRDLCRARVLGGHRRCRTLRPTRNHTCRNHTCRNHASELSQRTSRSGGGSRPSR